MAEILEQSLDYVIDNLKKIGIDERYAKDIGKKIYGISEDIFRGTGLENYSKNFLDRLLKEIKDRYKGETNNEEIKTLYYKIMEKLFLDNINMGIFKELLNRILRDTKDYNEMERIFNDVIKLILYIQDAVFKVPTFGKSLPQKIEASRMIVGYLYTILYDKYEKEGLKELKNTIEDLKLNAEEYNSIHLIRVIFYNPSIYMKDRSLKEIADNLSLYDSIFRSIKY